jgi:Protein of unknown function (DUF1176)
MFEMLRTTIVLMLAMSVGAPSNAANPQAFDAWIVGCDNLRVCEAVSLPDNEGTGDGFMGDGNLGLSVKRAAAPTEQPIVELAIIEALPHEEIRAIRAIAIDGKSTRISVRTRTGVILLGPSLSFELISAMRNANSVSLVDASGNSIGETSLQGFKAALRIMDERQYRVGTDSALAEPGKKPSDFRTIPPMPPVPQVRVAGRSNQPPRYLGVDAVERLRENDPCRGNGAREADDEPKYHRLDPQATLLILPTACGGYNPYRQLFVIDEAGHINEALFWPNPFANRDDAEDSEIRSDALADVAWDENARLLQSFARGRVLSDCGEAKEFAWEDGRFRLTHFSSMPVCRGRIGFITTYRLEVIVNAATDQLNSRQ